MFKKKKSGVEIDSVAADKANAPRFGKRYPPKAAIEEAGHEMKMNKPAIVKHTEKKFGKKRARRQAVAVMLNKARKGS
jgi:hypothetical protein